jgi:transposase
MYVTDDSLGLKLFKCYLCGREFKSFHSLAGHINWHKNQRKMLEVSKRAIQIRWQREKREKLKDWFNLKDEDLLKLHYEKKMTCIEIGKMFNVSQATVWQRFRKLGYKPKRWYKWQRAMPPKFELLQKLQNSIIRDVARAYGVSASTVWKWLKYYGIKLKKGRKINKSSASHSKKLHDTLLLEELSKFQKQGYRCIPLRKPLPDAIVIGGDNIKVYAIELETAKKPIDIEKYANSPYDDIIWIVVKLGHQSIEKLKNKFNNIILRESVRTNVYNR